MELHRTGLARLQSLATDFSSIDEQLSSIDQILDIDHGNDAIELELHEAGPRIVERKHQGHAEFALKWLLSRMQSSTEARSSSSAWRLLSILVLSLPSVASTRLLATSNFFKTLVTTLEELPSDVSQSQGPVPPAVQNAAERKVALFTSLASSLDGMTRPQKRQRQGHEKARGLLPRLETQSAARLLGLWLEGINHVRRESTVFEPQDASFLEPILRIWQASISDESDRNIISICFSDLCLAAATMFLISSTDQESSGSKRSLAFRDCRKKIEDLIHRHVLAPAKLAFTEDMSSDPLEKLIRPAIHTMRHMALNAAPINHDAIPILFSIAVRYSLPPRSLPGKRFAERGWLEAVFNALMKAAAIDPVEHLETIDPALQHTLQTLIELAKASNVPFSRDLLRSVASRLCKLDGTATPSWGTLAAIIALDEQAFIGDPLMQMLSDSISYKAPLALSTADTDAETYDSIKNQIILPIMRAYATARNLQGFVMEWHSCLTLSSSDDDSKTLSRSSESFDPRPTTIWQDQDLSFALAGLLESHLTSKQTSDLVNDLGKNILISELEHDSRQVCLASATILQVLMFAIRSDEIKASVLPTAKDLVTRSIRLAFSDRPISLALRRSLWQLASSAFHLWSGMADLADLSLHQLVGGREPALSRASSTFSGTHDCLEVLASLSSMLADLSVRHFQSKNIEVGALSALHCLLAFGSPADLVAHDEYALLAVVDKYPCLLELCRDRGENPVSEADVLRRIVQSTLRFDCRLGNADMGSTEVSAPKASSFDFLSPWLSLIRKAPAISRRAMSKVLSEIVTDDQEISMEPDIMVKDSDRFGLFISLSYSQFPPSKLTKTLRRPLRCSSMHPAIEPKAKDEESESDLDTHIQEVKADSSNLETWSALFRCVKNAKSLQSSQFDGLIEVLLAMSCGGAMATSAPSKCQNAKGELESIRKIKAGRIYHGLTKIVHILLSRHRKRLRERHHHLIPLLQSLLRCLFVTRPSGPGTTTDAVALQQPAWLTRDPSESPLRVRHAEQFNRLLTTLCDPALSSVQRRRKDAAQANLTDATKTARMYAGQYVPYLILSLCTFQLEGLFAEDGMREVLRPGVFAAFDAMGKEVHQTVHSSWEMSGAVRTLFRIWWEDWQKERERRT